MAVAHACDTCNGVSAECAESIKADPVNGMQNSADEPVGAIRLVQPASPHSPPLSQSIPRTPLSPQLSQSQQRSRIPISAVGVTIGRALSGHSPGHSPKLDYEFELPPRADSPSAYSIRSPTLSQHSFIPRPISPRLSIVSSPTPDPTSPNPQTAGNPFFGGGSGVGIRHAARVASANSSSSKVIASLQTELTSAKTVLEHTKQQLRLSGRANESLQRQLEDSKETQARLKIENVGVGNTLARKERMLEDLLSRARSAEAALSTLRDEHKVLQSDTTKRLKELESKLARESERAAKCESEYNAIKNGQKAILDGWKRELAKVRSEVKDLRTSGEKDLQTAKSNQASLTKLLSERTEASSSISTALQNMQVWQSSMSKKHTSVTTTLSRDIETTATKTRQALELANETRDEWLRFKKAVRTNSERDW